MSKEETTPATPPAAEQATPPAAETPAPNVGDDTLKEILSELKTLNENSAPPPAAEETPPPPAEEAPPPAAEETPPPAAEETPPPPAAEAPIQWPRDLNDEIDADEKAGR